MDYFLSLLENFIQYERALSTANDLAVSQEIIQLLILSASHLNPLLVI